MSANYTGFTPDQILSYLQNRYFYGLRRTDDGELFLSKVDQAKKDDSVTINKAGTPDGNFPNFEEGQDFFEGRNVFHNLVYENLNYEQFRWDDKNMYYYINDDGDLVLRINQSYTYNDTDSSAGL